MSISAVQSAKVILDAQDVLLQSLADLLFNRSPAFLVLARQALFLNQCNETGAVLAGR